MEKLKTTQFGYKMQFNIIYIMRTNGAVEEIYLSVRPMPAINDSTCSQPLLTHGILRVNLAHVKVYQRDCAKPVADNMLRFNTPSLNPERCKDILHRRC
ncbi:hypothetical protein [Cronobacter condimenti]|uniref:hypothetical protein n=1 Tax=Cronobacter condimenti TaxID=1163710 RepID=UPI000518BC12|nr:hypothetical protein [Cronobacter condimenti]